MDFLPFILITFGVIIYGLLGEYGKHTSFGFWGSVLLGIITTPLIGFIVVYFMRRKENRQREN